ncbi:hypothetical protein BT67DRAFT_437243 [Trichocladium antarcticum]|uniref:Uncharacterized protein n=1 Tax=Trichocladium antarcticum TaxID=1450529 RepID=A0AAN6Z8W1_9PEZI|nr:hypothetical protein BT67DRAFT_437243 [Trichocladium antarcticum]
MATNPQDYAPHSHHGRTTHVILGGELTTAYPADGGGGGGDPGQARPKAMYGAGDRIDVDARRVHEVWIGGRGLYPLSYDSWHLGRRPFLRLGDDSCTVCLITHTAQGLVLLLVSEMEIPRAGGRGKSAYAGGALIARQLCVQPSSSRWPITLHVFLLVQQIYTVYVCAACPNMALLFWNPDAYVE